MTRNEKKAVEATFVEQAARLLDVHWEIKAHREHPDFVISDGSTDFGLEVVQLFVDQGRPRVGSTLKQSESFRTKLLNEIRREHEARTGITLNVKVLGTLTRANAKEVSEILSAVELSEIQYLEPVTLRTPSGLKLFVSKASHPAWLCLGDAVGWVHQDPSLIVQQVIQSKSPNLDRYRQAVGCDVRLLIVADRQTNSGRAKFLSNPVLDACGFSAVYFLSHPDQAVLLCGAGAEF